MKYNGFRIKPSFHCFFLTLQILLLSVHFMPILILQIPARPSLQVMAIAAALAPVRVRKVMSKATEEISAGT